MKLFCFTVLSILVLVALAGCQMSKPYVMEMDRVDQKMEGNRGYLKGTPPPAEDRSNLKRPFIAVDIDLPSTAPEKEATMVREEPPVKKKAMREEEVK